MNATPDPSRASSPEPDSPALEWVAAQGVGDDVMHSLDVQLGRKRQHRRALAAVGALAVAALFFFLRGTFRPPNPEATAAAQRRQIELSDGTRAELNAFSEVSTDFRKEIRRVQLRQGEVFFDVTPDPQRPFVVETPAAIVRVLGTRFNVRLQGPQHVEITLLDGSVAVDGTPQPLHSQGQQVIVHHGERSSIQLDPAALDRALAWRTGRVLFSGTPLLEATARFAAYHGRSINVAPDAATLRLGGGYELDDLRSFLGALEDTLPVRVTVDTDGRYRITRR